MNDVFRREVTDYPKMAELWISKSIKLVDENESYINVPSVPAGTVRMKAGDELSRHILFVAICRTLAYRLLSTL